MSKLANEANVRYYSRGKNYFYQVMTAKNDYALTLFCRIPFLEVSKSRLNPLGISTRAINSLYGIKAGLFNSSVVLAQLLCPKVRFVFSPKCNLETLLENTSSDIRLVLSCAASENRIVFQEGSTFFERFSNAAKQIERPALMHYLIGSDSPWWNSLTVDRFIECAGSNYIIGPTNFAKSTISGAYLVSNCLKVDGSPLIDDWSDFFNDKINQFEALEAYYRSQSQRTEVCLLPVTPDLDTQEDIPQVIVRLKQCLVELKSNSIFKGVLYNIRIRHLEFLCDHLTALSIECDLTIPTD